MAGGDAATQHQAVLQLRLLKKLSGSMDKLSSQLDSIGGGRGGGGGGGARGSGAAVPSSLLDRARGASSNLFAGRAFGGGVAGLAAAGAATAAVGAAAIAAPVVGAGLLQAQRGGTFGAGATAAGIDLAAGIPLVGELSGAAGVQRVAQGATADMNAITNEVARYDAGSVTGRVRAFLAKANVRQNMNIEADRQANATAVNEAMFGRGGNVAEMIKTINHMVTAAGFQQHM